MRKDNNKDLTFSGLVVVKCKHCGEYAVFYTEKEINSFHCKRCGGDTSILNDPCTRLQARCECGKNTFGVTNSTEDMFEFNCKCSCFVPVEYVKRKNAYMNVK